MAKVWGLVRRFIVEHQGLTFDSRRSGMHLNHAGQLLNPKKEGQEAYTEEQVLTCLAAMKAGLFTPDWPKDKTANTLLAVLWGNPPFIERMKDIASYLPPKPPYYERVAVEAWKSKYGAFIHDESH